MRIMPEPREPRVPNIPIDRIRASYESAKDLSKTLGPAVEARGCRWGLFRGSWRCPVKDGALRAWWMNGCSRGIERRRSAAKGDK